VAVEHYLPSKYGIQIFINGNCITLTHGRGTFFSRNIIHFLISPKSALLEKRDLNTLGPVALSNAMKKTIKQ
jgi:hypothetical protein